MGQVASAYDNALMESFLGSMQIELLDRCDLPPRDELASAMFDWIGAFYNPPDATPGWRTTRPLHSKTSTTPPKPRHYRYRERADEAGTGRPRRRHCWSAEPRRRCCPSTVSCDLGGRCCGLQRLP